MYKLYDKDNGWKWIPFITASCYRKLNHTKQYDIFDDRLTNQGAWYLKSVNHRDYGKKDYISPSQEEIDSVTCREYTQCPKESEVDIKDSRISLTCEAFPDLDVTYGCKRYCLGYKL